MPEKERPHNNTEGKSHDEMVHEFASEGIGEEPENTESNTRSSNQDSKRIKEIRSTFEQKPELADARMAREIHQQDKQERVFQERDKTDRSIERIGRNRRRMALLAPFVAVGAFLGIYKGLDRQDEVNKIKDEENATRQKQIDRNKMSQQVNATKGKYRTDDDTEYKTNFPE